MIPLKMSLVVAPQRSRKEEVDDIQKRQVRGFWNFSMFFSLTQMLVTWLLKKYMVYLNVMLFLVSCIPQLLKQFLSTGGGVIYEAEPEGWMIDGRGKPGADSIQDDP